MVQPQGWPPRRNPRWMHWQERGNKILLHRQEIPLLCTRKSRFHSIHQRLMVKFAVQQVGQPRGWVGYGAASGWQGLLPRSEFWEEQGACFCWAKELEKQKEEIAE